MHITVFPPIFYNFGDFIVEKSAVCFIMGVIKLLVFYCSQFIKWKTVEFLENGLIEMTFYCCVESLPVQLRGVSGSWEQVSPCGVYSPCPKCFHVDDYANGERGWVAPAALSRRRKGWMATATPRPSAPFVRFLRIWAEIACNFSCLRPQSRSGTFLSRFSESFLRFEWPRGPFLRTSERKRGSRSGYWLAPHRSAGAE